jgi:hypothetical protein
LTPQYLRNMGRNVLLVEDDPRNILSYSYGPRAKLYPSPRFFPTRSRENQKPD